MEKSNDFSEIIGFCLSFSLYFYKNKRRLITWEKTKLKQGKLQRRKSINIETQ